MITDRADRLDRHGQVDRRGDVRARPACRCSTPMPRCAGCRARAARWSRRSSERFPGTTATARSIARRCRRWCSAIPTSSPRSRRSSIRRCTTRATRFIAEHGDAPALLFDIPLLFETGGDEAFDKVIVVSAPAEVQRARVLARPGMTAAQARRDPGPADARRGEARARRFRHRHRRRARSDNRRPGRRASSLVSDSRQVDKQRHAGNHLRHRNHRDSIRLAATAWSRSAASRCSTGSKPAATSTLISIPSGPMPSEAEAVHGLIDDLPVGQAAVRRQGRGIARVHRRLRRWSRTMPASISASSITSCSSCGRPPVCTSRMVDTLVLARTRHPGAKHSLDALCTRFGVDRSQRVKHGALLDAQLLAQVYVELTGGRQIGLGLVADTARRRSRRPAGHGHRRANRARPRPHVAAAEELERHRAFIAKLANPLWDRFADGRLTAASRGRTARRAIIRKEQPSGRSGRGPSGRHRGIAARHMQRAGSRRSPRNISRARSPPTSPSGAARTTISPATSSPRSRKAWC